jgi:hypothetical protein
LKNNKKVCVMIITFRLDYKINMSESENKITKKDKKVIDHLGRIFLNTPLSILKNLVFFV